MAHSSVVCSHCAIEFVSTDPSAQQSITCPNCLSEFLIHPVFEGSVAGNGQDGKSTPGMRPSVEHLLPPLFLVADPDFVAHRIQKGSSQFILLPDGKGGVKSINENIIRIEHRGRTVELVALPAGEKRKRQRIVNFVFIAIGILFLIVFLALI